MSPSRDPTEGSGWLKGTQLVLMTSAGRLLSGSMKYGDRKGLATALDEVLEAYAKLPEDQRRPASVDGEEKPVPAPPAGGLVLTIYDRPLGYADGQYRLPQGRDLGGLRTHAPSGQRSSLWLTREECQSLIPPNAQKGQTHPVPANLARRILLVRPVAADPVGRRARLAAGLGARVRAATHGRGRFSDNVAAAHPRQSSCCRPTAGSRIYPTSKFAKDLENRYDARLEGSPGLRSGHETRSCNGTWWPWAITPGRCSRPAKKTAGRPATISGARPRGSAGAAGVFVRAGPRALMKRPPIPPPALVCPRLHFPRPGPFYWDPEKWAADWKNRSTRSQ